MLTQVMSKSFMKKRVLCKYFAVAWLANLLGVLQRDEFFLSGSVRQATQ